MRSFLASVAAAIAWLSLSAVASGAATYVPPRTNVDLGNVDRKTNMTKVLANDPEMHVYDFFATGLASNTSYISFLVDPSHASPSSSAVRANYSCADIRPSPNRGLVDITAPVACVPPASSPDLPALSFMFAFSQDAATVGRELRIELQPAATNETAVVALKVVADWATPWTQDPSTGVGIQLYTGPADFGVEKKKAAAAAARALRRGWRATT